MSKITSQSVNVVIYARATRVVHIQKVKKNPDWKKEMSEFLRRSGISDYTVQEDGTAINPEGHKLQFEERG